MIRFSAHTTVPFIDLSFTLERGSFLAVYGPTGAGKTTLLRMLAGLASPGKGKIIVGGETWYDPIQKLNRPPQERSIGMVFQDFALFPHLTALENIAFAMPKGEDSKRVHELLVELEIIEWAERKPAQLSGGQKQRVALARALARSPRILLLDEAFAAQDSESRKRLQTYLRQEHQKKSLTTIMVSHDLPEVLHLADKVICIEGGRIAEQGDPMAVLGRKYDVY